MGHRHLGPEHILLGLLRDQGGTAVATLRSLGVSSEDLERCLGKLLKHWKLGGNGEKPAEHPQITGTAAAN
jgi:ATP-dependent Clp protease ATP-binding subunit ClpA